MNREIKFRAWDTACQQMILPDNSFSYWMSFNGSIKQHDVWATSDVILMQYTGLKDRNGKEIYEGDVIQHSAWDYPFTVIFYQYRARFVCEMQSGLTHYIANEEMEVIGNIYENPNLINQ